jgi:hypothetical protein
MFIKLAALVSSAGHCLCPAPTSKLLSRGRSRVFSTRVRYLRYWPSDRRVLNIRPRDVRRVLTGIPNREPHLMVACGAGINANMCRRIIGRKDDVREMHFLAASALGHIRAAGLQ